MIDMSGNICKLDEWQMHEDEPFYEGTERRAPSLQDGGFTVQNPVPGLLSYTPIWNGDVTYL